MINSSMIILSFVLVVTCSAFTPSTNNVQRIATNLNVVKFDKETQKWFTDDPEEMEGSSYGPIGSLYRAGPKPFFTRLFNPETYDQAVLKYMAQDGSCDRKEAQGNMDAFLDNPQDWGYQKMEEKNKGKVKKDYANANMGTKQVVLSTVWGGGVIYFLGDLTYKVLGTGVMAESFGRTKEILGF